MRLSKKGLYALQALMNLTPHFPGLPVKTRQIAEEEGIPEKFLELILLDLKAARFVESVRGMAGGYRLRREPSTIFLGDVIRAIDGPLSPIGDAQSLQDMVTHNQRHAALFQVFLLVRNAAARILDHTSLADLYMRHD